MFFPGVSVLSSNDRQADTLEAAVLFRKADQVMTLVGSLLDHLRTALPHARVEVRSPNVQKVVVITAADSEDAIRCSVEHTLLAKV